MRDPPQAAHWLPRMTKAAGDRRGEPTRVTWVTQRPALATLPRVEPPSTYTSQRLPALERFPPWTRQLHGRSRPSRSPGSSARRPTPAATTMLYPTSRHPSGASVGSSPSWPAAPARWKLTVVDNARRLRRDDGAGRPGRLCGGVAGRWHEAPVENGGCRGANETQERAA